MAFLDNASAEGATAATQFFLAFSASARSGDLHQILPKSKVLVTDLHYLISFMEAIKTTVNFLHMFPQFSQSSLHFTLARVAFENDFGARIHCPSTSKLN